MPDVAEILGEAEWLTRLARSLTGSAADADDVGQDTYAAARGSPPEPERPVRPWLRRVATNIVRMRHRGRIRRDAREAVITQIAEPMRTPEQLLERARIERTLTDLVLALEEPYRTTILLRYREGLAAETIAQKQGVPAGTVRWRLKTGGDRLRSRRDERESPKTWRAAFAPFLAMRGRRAPWWRLVLAMAMTKTGVAVIALLLLASGGAALVWNAKRGASDDHASIGTRAAAHPTVVMQGSAADPVVFAQAGLGRRAVAGRVSYQTKPFAGATVRIVHALTQTTVGEATSGQDGAFSFAGLPADTFVVTASAAGTAIGGDGKPGGDAWITIDPRGKGASRDAVVQGRSAADGSFRLNGVAPGRVQVSAVAPGARSRAIGVVLGAGETREGLIVRLDRAPRFTGRVMERGNPVAGASVGLRVGSLSPPALAVSQADGSFTIDRATEGDLGVIVEGYTVVAPHSVRIAADTTVDIEVASLTKVHGIVPLHGMPLADE